MNSSDVHRSAGQRAAHPTFATRQIEIKERDIPQSVGDFAEFLSHLPCPAILTTADGREVLCSNSLFNDQFSTLSTNLAIRSLHTELPDSSGSVVQREIHIPDEWGRDQTFGFSSKRISLKDDTVILSTLQNISDRVQREKKLEESEDLFRSLAETALDSIFCKDLERRYTYVNPAMTRIFNCTAEDLLGKTPEELFDEKIASIIREVDDPVLEGKISDEVRTLTIHGEDRTFHTIQTPRRDASGKITGMCGFVRELTDYKESEARLKLLSSITEQISDSVIVTDLSFNITYTNRSFEKLFGYQREEVIGWSPNKFNAEPDAERTLSNLTEAIIDGRKWEGELLNRRKDGSLFICELVVFPVFDEEGENFAYGSIQRDITERKRVETLLRKNRAELERRVQERTTSLRSVNDKLKEEIAERRRIEAEILKAKRTAELASRTKSEFITRISHEIRTPITSIVGFSQMLQARKVGELNNEQSEFLEIIQRNSEHLLGVIEEILDLSSIHADRAQLSPHTFDLYKTVENCFNMVHNQILSKQIKFSKNLDGVQNLCADEKKIKHVLLNLLSNACKFSAEGSEVGIVTEKVGSDVQFSVWDHGIGIPEDCQERVFDEFFQVEETDTRQYGGTGIGLTICKKFVELHGGKIWVESKPGKGSRFSFLIPQPIAPNESL